MIQRDVERYATLLRLVASLSRLFSDNDAPYVDSRFVERLFVETTGAEDLGRKDISFDAKINDIGVGVKTFLAGTGNSKREKVAEFTAYAGNGRFVGLSNKELVDEVVRARNDRVLSDANEVGIDVAKSIYHCLIRMPGGVAVHEETYGLINQHAIKPTSSAGKVVSSWEKMGPSIYFTDGVNNYSFSIAKNVLMKQFVFDRQVNYIPVEIINDPLADLESKLVVQSANSMQDTQASKARRKERQQAEQELFTNRDLGLVVGIDNEALVPGRDYIVLPLYSVKDGNVFVPERSGINQWNAEGRARKLGEAYVPIPRLIHKLFPDFFPARDEPFQLRLPNRSDMVVAKVCQQGSKALMTNPNFYLGKWIIGVVNPTIALSDFEQAPSGVLPVTYDDLLRIEKDCVRVVRRPGFYEIQFGSIGEYENFIGTANARS